MGVIKTKEENRLAVRLNATMAEYVSRQTGSGGLYDNASEFIRDLIRHHMQKMPSDNRIALGVLRGLDDVKEGRYHAFDDEKIRKASYARLEASRKK